MYKNRHLELSNVVSASNVFKNWISDSKIEKVAKEFGLNQVKSLILEDLNNIVGKNLSAEKFKQYKENIEKQNTNFKLMNFITNALLKGDNMGII